jgi:hypothetical protein
MKKQFLLFLLFLIAFSGFSQNKQKTIGVLTAPGSYYRTIAKRFNFTYTNGVFYDHLFTSRSGINTGVSLFFDKQELVFDGRCRDCQLNRGEADKVVFRRRNLEVPLNYTFTLNPNSKTGLKALLYTGFTFNWKLSENGTWYYPNNEITRKYTVDNTHLVSDSYMNLGFEMRKNLMEHYVLAIGTSAKFHYATGFDFLSEVGEPVIFNLNLKFGRNL